MPDAVVYQASLICDFAEADRLSDALAEACAGDKAPPSVALFEDGDAWRMDIYITGAPEPDRLAPCFASAGIAYTPDMFSAVEDRDWVTESQRFLKPIKTKRFYLHGSHDAAGPDGLISLQIDAGQAFGTGHHETTRLCLEVLESLDCTPRRRILDVGTGSAVLAMAAHTLWPGADILATDIDPVAIEVARTNLAVNSIAPEGIGGIDLLVADGLAHDSIQAFGKVDLLIANILAGPLIAFADDFARVLAQAGRVLLSGLLASQVDDVLTAYSRVGLKLTARRDDGDWSALLLEHM